MMKNTKEMATEYRMGQWAEKMSERESSGLSITAYCEREGMPTNRYFYWQRRLRAAAAKELAAAKTETILPIPSGWTQAIPSKEGEALEKGEVTIEIGKCRITANEGTNADILTKVCKVLVELC